jgi:hypothetical protein
MMSSTDLAPSLVVKSAIVAIVLISRLLVCKGPLTKPHEESCAAPWKVHRRPGFLKTGTGQSGNERHRWTNRAPPGTQRRADHGFVSADGREWRDFPPRTVDLPANLKLRVTAMSMSQEPFTVTLVNFMFRHLAVVA